MAGDMGSFGGSSDESTVIKQVGIALAVLLVGLFFGRQVALNYMVPVGLLGGFFLLFFLVTQPVKFLLLGIFVAYGTFDILDMETFGRVRGLFRLKDIFLVLLVGYMILTSILAGARPTPLRWSRAYRPWLLFLLWIGLVFAYTVKVLGESPMLALRVGRTYLAYGLPYVLLWFLRTEREWTMFHRYVYGLGGFAILLGVLRGLGVPTSLTSATPETVSGSAEQLGLFRFGNPSESLVFALFILSFWRFAFKPTRRHALVAMLMAFGGSLFLYRARIAGTLLGVLAGVLLAPLRVRIRAVVIGTAGTLLLLLAVGLFGIVAKPLVRGHRDSYMTRMAEFFESGVRGLIHGDTADVIGRRYSTRIRWPLVQERPVMGIGFVSPFGVIAWSMYEKGGMPIGTVDVGWMDVLVRLGFGGALVLLVLLLSVVMDALGVYRMQGLTDDEQAMCLALIGYIVLMLFSVYSFSYPTYEMAIITFGILFAFVVHIRERHTPVPEEGAPGPGAPAARSRGPRRISVG